MIRSYGTRPDVAFQAYLERVEQHAFGEVTSDGFDYLVADPEVIGISSGIVGQIRETADFVEVELVLGEDIAQPARDQIARICFTSAAFNDRYAVARACDEIIKDVEPESLPVLTRHISENLAAHLRGIRQLDGRGRYGETHPLTRDMLKSSLGWLALRRPTNERGQQNVERLIQAGFDIPDFDSDQRLAAQLQTKKGGKVPVGIVAAPERDERHPCRCCSGQILKGTTRITLSLDKPDGRYDHHHYHTSCFAETTLGKLDLTHARIEPNPFALSLVSHRRKK